MGLSRIGFALTLPCPTRFEPIGIQSSMFNWIRWILSIPSFLWRTTSLIVLLSIVDWIPIGSKRVGHGRERANPIRLKPI